MIFNWIKNFDATKAVVLAIVGIVSSWYDVRGQVNLLQQEAKIRWEKQDKKDYEQDEADREMREEIRQQLRDIQQALNKKR